MQVTRILVAHRPETIQSADRVITLEDGKVQRDEKRRLSGATAIPPTEVSVSSLYRAYSAYWLSSDTESRRNGNGG